MRFIKQQIRLRVKHKRKGEKSGGSMNITIEFLVEDKKRTCNKCLMTKNAENRERYKRPTRVMKERIKERKNRMSEVKCRKMNMVESLERSTQVWRFLKNLRNNSQLGCI
jgi:hypothetical protein